MGLELRAGSILGQMPKVPAFTAASPEMTSIETMLSRFFLYCLIYLYLCDCGFLVIVEVGACFISGLGLILMIWKFKLFLPFCCFTAELAVLFSFSLSCS